MRAALFRRTRKRTAAVPALARARCPAWAASRRLAAGRVAGACARHAGTPKLACAMEVDELLQRDRAAILEDTWRAFARIAHHEEDAWRSVPRPAHYERDGEQATRARLDALFDQIAQAIRSRDMTELREHADRIGKERFEAGFDLAEVQSAFNMIEEAIWRRALERLPASELTEALGLVATAVAHGREALGRVYLALAGRRRKRSLGWSAAFKGTEGP